MNYRLWPKIKKLEAGSLLVCRGHIFIVNVADEAAIE
jgi:hypothetical protein